MTSPARITDPEKDISVWQRARLYAISKAKDQEEQEKIRKRADHPDRHPRRWFGLHALPGFRRVSALDIGYGGEPDADAYHSIYDDFYWYTHFSTRTSCTLARSRKQAEQR